MRFIDIDIKISDYDLKKILSTLKEINNKKSMNLALSAAKKMPEKFIFSLINSKISRKMAMPKVISKVNKTLKEKGLTVMIDDVNIENTDSHGMDISLKLNLKSYKSLIPLIKQIVNDKVSGKVEDERITAVLNTAIDVIFADIPNVVKDRVINNIVNNSSTEICGIASDILSKKELPVELNDININVYPKPKQED